MNFRAWTTALSRAGVAYAAIVLSIMGINIPTDEPIIAKKVTEHASPSDRAGGEQAADAAGNEGPARS